MRPGAGARRSYAKAVTFAISLFMSSTAQLGAQTKDDLEIALSVDRVMRKGNEERFEDAATAGPGDVVRYRAVYRNQSSGPLRQLAPTLPIPVGTEYVANSAWPLPAEASLDGQTYETLPIRRLQRRPDGTEELRAVPASAFRALRWRVGELAPGSAFSAMARVRVISK